MQPVTVTASETLSNNLDKERLQENETEVKQALKLLIIEAERGDKTAQEILTFIKNTANKKA